MEPLGIIVFAVVITTSFSQVLLTSLERLTQPMTAEPIDLSPIALLLLASNIIIKGILWIWCASVKGSSSVQALAQDHENDVVFNIASTIFPVLGIRKDESISIRKKVKCFCYSCLGKITMVRSSGCYFAFALYYL